HPVLGLEYLLWGQVIATILAWLATLLFTCHAIGASRRAFILDLAPYAAQAALIAPVMSFFGHLYPYSGGRLIIEILTGLALYLLINKLAGSKIQSEVLHHLK
ncbi:MAG: hypothetical protein K2M06_08660, partial [Muribaculaceae bacterium]|nr:hypothetical protein [Muribaculaceae bacterium]